LTAAVEEHNPMNEHRNLLDELQDAIAAKDMTRRAEVLRQVTDLFVIGSANFSPDQVALFDDVMHRLCEEIDGSVRAVLSLRLADLPNAPPRMVRMLALDDAIEVAEPMLSRSRQVDDDTLVEGARTKSQEHLIAIAQRSSLAEAVTDVLVTRGNQEVAVRVAGNPGAKFSEFGYSTLVSRAEQDAELASRVWARPEIPRPHLLKLFAAASETVRLRLEATDRRKADLYREMVAKAADELQAFTRANSRDYAAARDYVESLQRAGTLSESRLEALAWSKKFEEAVMALALMCDMPVGAIERAMVEDGSEQLLVLARAIGLSWSTTQSLLLLRNGPGDASAEDINQTAARFSRLQPETARKAIEFYRLRARAALAKSA
jgi:uncharacterized protein (DUF2336 family)